VASCAINHFISNHDPSGFDLQRAWEETLYNFDAPDIAKAVPAVINKSALNLGAASPD
jgi:hypothetical protein